MLKTLSSLSTFGRSLNLFGGLQGMDMASQEPADLKDVEQRERELGLDSSHLYRLFVGWVPKLFTEQDLQPLFQQCGDVKDLLILTDKVTGQPRGCAFVSYATKGEAEAAIARLDRKVHLPGALNPMEVRFARSHQYIQAGSGPQDNRQLFFARAPPTATEKDVRALFAQHGQVEEINLFRERRTHASKGCGFVTLATREQAVAAMDALDGAALGDPGAAPLAVKWADPDLQVKKRRAVEDSNAENRMLFFAKVLRSANEDDVRAVFARFGRVYDVNLFRAFQGAPTTKGCGLVTMGSNEEAVAAINALDSRYVWEGMDGPMVVKWMDAALQKRRREEHLAAMRQGLVPSMGLGPELYGGSRLPGGLSAAQLMGTGAADRLASAAAAAYAPQESPPSGCAPDAYKLFVGNVPKHLGEEALRPLFEAVGRVVELVVVRDKFSHESKGSAFVWYATRALADAAVAHFNLRPVIADPAADPDRTLVVRRANVRRPAGGAAGLAAPPGAGGTSPARALAGLQPSAAAAAAAAAGMLLHPGDAMAAAGLGDLTSAAGLMGEVPVHVLAAQLPQQAAQAYAYAPAKGPVGPGQASSQLAALGLSLDALSLRSDGSGAGASNAMLDAYQRHGAGGMLPGPATAASPGGGGGGGGYDTGAAAAAAAAYLMAGGGGGGLDAAQTVSLSLQLSSTQMAALTGSGHLYQVGAMTGADLASQPVAPGVYCLVLTGAQHQVEAAKNLVAAVLSQHGLV